MTAKQTRDGWNEDNESCLPDEAAAARPDGQDDFLSLGRFLTESLRPLRQARPGYRAQLQARLVAQLPAARRSWWRRRFPWGIGRPLLNSSLRLASGTVNALLILIVVGTAIATVLTASALVRRANTEQAASASTPTLVPQRQIPEVQSSFPMPNLLAASNRDRLRFCVQSLTPAVTDTAIQRAVVNLLPQILGHPDYKAAGLDAKPPVVDLGCPGTSLIDQPGFQADGISHNRQQAVAEASPYRTFIYVAPVERLTAAGLSAGLPRQLPVREYQQGSGGTYVPVTTELYLTPAELADSAALVRSLYYAAGLKPPGEQEDLNQRTEAEQQKLKAFATRAATRPPQVRTGATPVPLRKDPSSREPGPDLTPGTVLTLLGPESVVEEYGGTALHWYHVQDGQGRKGYVLTNEVTPLPEKQRRPYFSRPLLSANEGQSFELALPWHVQNMVPYNLRNKLLSAPFLFSTTIRPASTWEAAPFETVAAWGYRLRMVAEAVTAVAREQATGSL